MAYRIVKWKDQSASGLNAIIVEEAMRLGLVVKRGIVGTRQLF